MNVVARFRVLRGVTACDPDPPGPEKIRYTAPAAAWCGWVWVREGRRGTWQKVVEAGD
jgi:hypothetical protein